MITEIPRAYTMRNFRHKEAPGGIRRPELTIVEVPGIEPGSFSTSPGLLRAQPAFVFLSPGDHAGKTPTGSATV